MSKKYIGQGSRVVIATQNAGKLREINEALSQLGWQFEGIGKYPIPEENGSTYEENAALKACALSLMTGLPTLADDSGLEVTAINGEPGVYSARYGGKATDLDRNLFLLEQMRGKSDRSAKFVAVIVVAYPDGSMEEYRGEVLGTILEGPRGDGGFGYDPLFVPAGHDRSMAEMSVEEKRAISHRGRALASLLSIHKNGLAQ